MPADEPGASTRREVSRAEFDELAHLARIAFADAEAEAIRAELATILDHVAALAEFDDGLRPMTHGHTTTHLRDDAVQPSLSTAEATGGAAVVLEDLFVVPAAFAGGES